jgi:hypothetical protein
MILKDTLSRDERSILKTHETQLQHRRHERNTESRRLYNLKQILNTKLGTKPDHGRIQAA